MVVSVQNKAAHILEILGNFGITMNLYCFNVVLVIFYGIYYKNLSDESSLGLVFLMKYVKVCLS
jgi:hypothetical protein